MKLGKEVYGTITLAVSMPVDSNEEYSKIEAGYKVNEYNILELLKDKLEELGLDIHNGDVDWTRYFGEGEA